MEDGGWQVADGEPDVVDGPFVSANHQKIGEVEDLLADPNAQKVRYLTVEVDDSVAGSSDRTMRIPIERARLLEGERRWYRTPAPPTCGTSRARQRNRSATIKSN